MKNQFHWNEFLTTLFLTVASTVSVSKLILNSFCSKTINNLYTTNQTNTELIIKISKVIQVSKVSKVITPFSRITILWMKTKIKVKKKCKEMWIFILKHT